MGEACSTWAILAGCNEGATGCPLRYNHAVSSNPKCPVDGRSNSGGPGVVGQSPEKRSFGSDFGMKVVFLSGKVAKLPTHPKRSATAGNRDMGWLSNPHEVGADEIVKP